MLVNVLCIHYKGHFPTHKFTLKNLELGNAIDSARRHGFIFDGPNVLFRVRENRREELVIQGIHRDSFKHLDKHFNIRTMFTWLR